MKIHFIKNGEILNKDDVKELKKEINKRGFMNWWDFNNESSDNILLDNILKSKNNNDTYIIFIDFEELGCLRFHCGFRN
jgi:hypothetical protein